MKSHILLLTIASSLLFAVSSKQDDKTGLMWQDNHDVLKVTKMHAEAIEYCQKLKLDGFEDWRLPTLAETYTIVDMRVDRPALKKGFEVRIDDRFWTATPFAGNPKKEAWRISMSYGEAESYSNTRTYHVRCVRGSIAR